jgi:ABC-type glycerol-3-phosphate transport system substrate-binding protein
MKFLFAAVVLSLGLAACSKSEVSSGSSGATASTQLTWDQGNWNQTNWQ